MAAEPLRHLYRLVLPCDVIVEPPPHLALRNGTRDDDAALAALMEAAYAGTVDEDLGDNSDGAVEIAQWHDSGADPAASVIVHDGSGVALAAALVSALDETTALLAYVITDPEHKGAGLATVATSMALVELAVAGKHLVIAGVTEGNTPSERLMQRFGFERIR